MFNKIVTAFAILACVSNAHKDDRRECRDDKDRGHNQNPATGGVSAASVCSNPGVLPWYYNTRTTELNDCAYDGASRWGMISAYRSGGTEGTHWKYTTTMDSSCLTNWIYYNSDGTTCQNNDCSVISGLTTRADTQSWCAMNTYRSGGVENKQWKYCSGCGSNANLGPGVFPN